MGNRQHERAGLSDEHQAIWAHVCEDLNVPHLEYFYWAAEDIASSGWPYSPWREDCQRALTAFATTILEG